MVNCNFKQTDYYLAQFLSGDGHFEAHWMRFNLSESEECLYCGMPDTPQYAALECDRWEAEGDALVRAEVRIMLKDKNYKLVITYSVRSKVKELDGLTYTQVVPVLQFWRKMEWFFCQFGESRTTVLLDSGMISLNDFSFSFTKKKENRSL